MRARLVIALIIFFAAFGVRVLSWHDTRLTVGKVQSSVAEDYKRIGNLLRQDGIRGFFSSSSHLSDLNNLGHPPGYSALIAFIYSSFGESDAAVQFIQITFDAASAVLIFLIVAELFSIGPATLAGALTAFSPQLAWNSVLLLPDSLAVFPILLAVFLLARTRNKPRLITFIVVGALVGISCWLRANALLLTLFLAAAVPLLVKKPEMTKGPTNFSLSLPHERDKLKFVGQRWRYALAVVCGTLLIIFPLTLRNAIVFHRFIPVSLGAGQTLLEGIADYDSHGRFGIPSTDMGIMKQEAESFQRPDYYGTLFNPDGVERERWRMARGFAVIRSHPLWFSGVMIRRAASMLRLERTRLISPTPPISHSLDSIPNLQPIWIATPNELLSSGSLMSPQAKVSLNPDGQVIELIGDNSKYGRQFAGGQISVRQNTDDALIVPVQTEKGRMKIEMIDASGRALSSAIVETVETKDGGQPMTQVSLPFVATNDQQVRISLSNEASNPPNPVVSVGTVKLYELGPARWLWTRYPRLVVHVVQRIFLTAIMLPLALLGLAIVIIRKHSSALVILSVVPLYYFCVQSPFHTEYRYVLAVNYFVFAFAAVGIAWVTNLKAKIVSWRRAPLQSNR